MELIALTSTGPLSGKTTLALELEKWGFKVANHALTLANLFVKYTQECCYPGMSLKELYDDKEFWRPGLQRFGRDILFGDAPRYIDMTISQVIDPQELHYFLVESTINDWPGNPEFPLIVFDNVRTNQQAKQMKERGFTIVQLHIPEFIRQKRAGSDEQYRRIVQAMTDEVEKPIDRRLVDLRISGTQEPDVLARNLKEHTLEQLRDMPYPLR